MLVEKLNDATESLSAAHARAKVLAASPAAVVSADGGLDVRLSGATTESARARATQTPPLGLHLVRLVSGAPATDEGGAPRTSLPHFRARFDADGCGSFGGLARASQACPHARRSLVPSCHAQKTAVSFRLNSRPIDRTKHQPETPGRSRTMRRRLIIKKRLRRRRRSRPGNFASFAAEFIDFRFTPRFQTPPTLF